MFTQYLQQSKLIEGSMIYNNTEFYLQDNWKVNGRLTLDYGLRFTHQQPQHDQFLQMSNFFPDEWSLGSAPLLYIAGCSNGATVCSGNARNAVDPRNGQIVTAPGAANSAALIGTVVPNTGNVTNGVHQAGDGIADTSYVWPALVAAPRFGAAYDLTGDATFVLRGGGGLFFDRPDGNTVFSIPGNPPISTAQDLRNGQLSTLGTGSRAIGVPAMIIFQYDAELPSSWQWQGGVQIGAAVVGDGSTSPMSATTASTGCASSRAPPTARWTSTRSTSARPICRRTRIRRSARARCRARARTPRTCCARSAASATSTSSRRGSGTSTTACSSR